MSTLFNRGRPVALVCAVLFLSVPGRSDPPNDILATQPDDQRSVINFSDGTMTDVDFSTAIGNTLVNDAGQSNVMNFSFFGQQCCAGGILPDLDTALSGAGVKWVGATASQHNEVTKGMPSRREKEAAGQPVRRGYPENHPDFWTAGLITAMRVPNASVFDIAGSAIRSDVIGTHGRLKDQVPGGPENGQRISRNTADTFRIREPGAMSFHAILLAGNPDFDRYFADVVGVYDALENTWGDPNTNANVSIEVLFGDGAKNSAGADLPAKWNAKAATKANFQNELTRIKPLLNDKEQVFVYVTDHGAANGRIINLVPGTVAPSERGNGNFGVGQNFLFGYAEDPLNSDPAVSVNLEWSGSSAPGQTFDMLVNGTPIGSFEAFPGLNTLTSHFSEDLLQESNTVSVDNLTQAPFSFVDGDFLGGGFNTIGVEPPGFPMIHEFFTLFDNFDQVDEFGNPLPFDIFVTGPQSHDGLLQSNVPQLGLVRGSFLSNFESEGSVRLKSGVSTDLPQTLQFEFIDAQPGEAAIAQVAYELDAIDTDGALLNENTSFQVQLADDPTGDLILTMILLDLNNYLKIVPMHLDSAPNLYEGYLADGFGNPEFDDGAVRTIIFEIEAIANSNVRVLIDSMGVIPEPGTAVMVAVLALMAGVRGRGNTALGQ